MHVANLELCKQLFELSRWADTEHCYYANGGSVNGDIVHQRSMVFDKPNNVPAYDLGYLLRKLPETIEWEGYYYGLVWHKGGMSSFFEYSAPLISGEDKRLDITHSGLSFDRRVFEADIPEAAACELAIELLKQGVLLPPKGKF